jgi:LDH2 family malate/lactate/ureidoglycolate dehydrogenase
VNADFVHRVPEAALRSFVVASFDAAGLDGEQSVALSDSLVEADLRGTHSHGVIRLPFLVQRLLDGGANRKPRITTVRDATATALLDGDRALGAVAARRAMELAMTKAASHGIGMVGVRNSDFIGTCAHYAMMAPPRDMIGIAWTNGFPGMAAWGGRTNTIGNNPIAFAAPSARHGDVVLDMALSVAAGGRIRVAAKNGERIPSDWLLDRDGNATDDPAALAAGGALLPLGYKGFGLAMFGEILCGALLGARMLGEIPAWFKATEASVENGHVHIAIDIASFGEPGEVKERIGELVETLKASPLKPGADEILFPGERASRTADRHRREGIAVPEPVAADLRALATRLRVGIPHALNARDPVPL